MRIPEVAFGVSGLFVIGAVLLTSALRVPDLPGFVLVVTGLIASLLARHRRRELRFQVLGALVGLATAIVGLHWFLHRLNAAHDWLEPVYFGTVVVYVGTAIYVSHGLLGSRIDHPSS